LQQQQPTRSLVLDLLWWGRRTQRANDCAPEDKTYFLLLLVIIIITIMKWTVATVLLVSLLERSSAFSVTGSTSSSSRSTRTNTVVAHATASKTESSASTGASKTQDPLLIRAARGEKTDRTPVWMMRQAGRHIKEYRDLCKEYPTFRQRSEIPDVAVEVSLQPWRNYKTDGCILFSDILTPLPGMGLEFTIDEKLGPIMEPIKNWDDLKKVRDA
jgi:hypothetical protein